MTEETAISVGSIYQAIPQLEINGVANETIQESLVAMQVKETEGGLCSAELCFFNTANIQGQGVGFGFESSAETELALGSRIKIYCGDNNDPVEIFSGVISALEWVREIDQQPQLVVLAEDGLQQLRMMRKTQLHPAATLKAMIENILREHGLNNHIDGLQHSLDAQLQYNETDLGFIRRLIQRYDADIQMNHGQVVVKSRAAIQQNQITLELNSQLLSCRLCADLAHQVNQVTYAGWDSEQGQQIAVQSNANADLGPGEGRIGADYLTQYFANRQEHLCRTSVQNESEAQILVNSAYAKRARGFVRAQGKSLGNPNLKVGSHIQLNGIGERFENQYYVIEVTHYFTTAGGYLTEFVAQSAYFGG
ncbi:phage late control D family protein [Aliikangiella maris]|uniref:Contractile injection system protein, VgrG/Pvc8 family n=2 Tax=Aliikangiella maris TaxID=3162458 RepID=A0ABV3MKH6_9GAMM